MGPLSGRTPDLSQLTGAAHRRRSLLITVAALIAVAVAVAGTLLVLRPGSDGATASTTTDRQARAAARNFLATYVDSDGRVVRRDQGGDTVSEGQAYAMLAAVTAGDKPAFDRTWSWSQQNLSRSDGLLSWKWSDGTVTDPSSAADADLDAAWALALAGKEFGDAQDTRDGRTLATAILRHETVSTPVGQVLVAGSWATTAPYPVNPSYFAPAAYAELRALTGDPTWAKVADSSRTLLISLVRDRHLPPDWAQVGADGTVTASNAPDGAGPQFGDDAGRVPVWYASSCARADRQVAASLEPLLDDSPAGRQSAAYDLAGSPQVGYDVPLGQVAAAAAAGAAGDSSAVAKGLADAATLAAQQKTYYGSAWLALGRTLLTTDILGSCPTQGDS